MIPAIICGYLTTICGLGFISTSATFKCHSNLRRDTSYEYLEAFQELKPPASRSLNYLLPNLGQRRFLPPAYIIHVSIQKSLNFLRGDKEQPLNFALCMIKDQAISDKDILIA